MDDREIWTVSELTNEYLRYNVCVSSGFALVKNIYYFTRS